MAIEQVALPFPTGDIPDVHGARRVGWIHAVRLEPEDTICVSQALYDEMKIHFQPSSNGAVTVAKHTDDGVVGDVK